jgi:hypothetical protein
VKQPHSTDHIAPASAGAPFMDVVALAANISSASVTGSTVVQTSDAVFPPTAYHRSRVRPVAAGFSCIGSEVMWVDLSCCQCPQKG